MPGDALGILQSKTTVTATHHGSGYDLRVGTPPRGLNASFVIESFASVGTAGTVFIPTIFESADNSVFTVLMQGEPITGTTAAQSRVVSLTFVSNRRFVRASLVLTPVHGTPSAVYTVDLMAGPVR